MEATAAPDVMTGLTVYAGSYFPDLKSKRKRYIRDKDRFGITGGYGW